MIFVGKNKLGHNIYRGPRPYSHKKLESMGIKFRIDLQSGMFEHIYNDELEFEIPSAYGVTVIDYDLSDVFPPTRTQVHDILSDIDHCDGDVFIHCLHGKDRTGFICAAWHLIHKMPWHLAIQDLYEKGFHKIPYLWWVWYHLRRYEKSPYTFLGVKL